MGSKLFDRCAGGAFLFIGLVTIIGSFSIAGSVYGSKVGPNIFPLGLGMIIAFLSICLLYQTFRYDRQTKEKADLDYKRLGLTLLAMCIYIAVFETLGYVISTFLFLVAAFQIMDRSKLLLSVAIAAGFAFAVYYFYVVTLQGSLPPLPQW